MYRKWYILDLYDGVTKSCFRIFPPAVPPINLKNIFRRSFAKKRYKFPKMKEWKVVLMFSLMSLYELKYSIFSSLGYSND